MILHPDKKAFLHKCLDVLDHYGTKARVHILGNELDGIMYEDELIFIQKSSDDLWMEIVRKLNNNPFYFMYNGDSIRFHGEYIYLEDHVNKLLESV